MYCIRFVHWVSQGLDFRLGTFCWLCGGFLGLKKEKKNHII